MIFKIKYEMKKYVITKSNFVLLIAITLISIGGLFWSEGGYFAEKDMRQSFYKKITERNFSVEDKQKIAEQRERLEQNLYGENFLDPKEEEMTKPGKYADTKLDDYELFGEVLTCIDILEKRNRNTVLLADQYRGKKGDYQAENNQMLVDRKKLTASLHNMLFGGLPCFFVIFIFSSSFAMEHENSINHVLHITKKGNQIYLSKLLTGIITAIVLNLYFWGIYYIFQFFFLGMTVQDWRQPLFFVEGCQMCASGVTIGSLFVKQILVSVLVSILMVLLTMLLSKVIRRSVFTLLVAMGIFVITLLPDLLNTVIYRNTYLTKMSEWYVMSEPDFYRMLKMEKIINPVSLLQFQYYVEQPRYLQIADYQYPVDIFPILGAAFLIMIFSFALSNEKRRR